MTVLIITEQLDVTTDLVVKTLTERGVRVHRVDTGDFPQNLTLAATINPGRSRWSGSLADLYRDTELGDITGVYYRHPSPFRLPAGLTDYEQQWARLEARMGFGGVLGSLSARWVNHPTANAAAEYKPRQLAAAAAIGLTIPHTLITNDPTAVVRFRQEAPDGKVVYKPLTQLPYVDEGSGQVAALSTTLVDNIDGRVAGTAHLFQHLVVKDHEVRVTIVGDRLFPVRIDAGSDQARLDWRTDYAALSYSTTTLPDEIADKLRDLVHTLGLRFAAVDMAVTPSGEYVFFEVNPNGQWAWLEFQTGAPISAAIAEELEPH